MTLAPSPTALADGARFLLAIRPPYDWAHLERFFADHASPGVEHVTPGRYARSFVFGGRHGTLSVTPEAEALSVRIRGLDTDDARSAVVARVRAMFDLDIDPRAIADGLGRDPLTAALVARRPGLRMPGAFEGFELAVRAILGQQVSVAAATRLAGRLVASFGTPLAPDEGDGEPGLTHLFPTPEQLLDAEISLVLNMPRARGRAIQGLAAAMLATPDLFALGGDLDDRVPRLKALPGIGEWTAQYVAMRALAQADAFPAGDVGLMRALDTGAGRPDRAALLDRAAAWRPWRAYAAIHLWAEDAARRMP
ncbi:DNA-3-methyladenine glycosylase family protein [Methylorubrum podarium]|uniref:DNA-3-methyladenine glycosylase family protein n=1 Tax=Methylorubrum podarium TaxID=200476 RepID=UPI001EE22D15|nr:AlkA N-terminal domain-containing protein [Methylorubrum podarium]GJE69620.1 putative bifunctional transcriptional activator/DNA repair enzyme AlkA [Methylorubrum podarium]